VVLGDSGISSQKVSAASSVETSSEETNSALFMAVVLSEIASLFVLGLEKRAGFENPAFKVGCLQRLFKFFDFSAIHQPRDG
jgi:hypothetical protein